MTPLGSTSGAKTFKALLVFTNNMCNKSQAAWGRPVDVLTVQGLPEGQLATSAGAQDLFRPLGSRSGAKTPKALLVFINRL